MVFFGLPCVAMAMLGGHVSQYMGVVAQVGASVLYCDKLHCTALGCVVCVAVWCALQKRGE